MKNFAEKINLTIHVGGLNILIKIYIKTKILTQLTLSKNMKGKSSTTRIPSTFEAAGGNRQYIQLCNPPRAPSEAPLKSIIHNIIQANNALKAPLLLTCLHSSALIRSQIIYGNTHFYRNSM